MISPEIPKTPFPTAEEDVSVVRLTPDTAQTRSPSYCLAYADAEFILRDELCSVRLQLELLKPELLQNKKCIHSTVVIVGSTLIHDEESGYRTTAEDKSTCGGNTF